MSANYLELESKAKSKTSLYLFIFVLLTVGVAFLIEVVARGVDPEDYNSPYPLLGFAFMGLTFAVALFQYLRFRSQGGSVVAKAAGGYLVDPNTSEPTERMLIHTVRELARQSKIPMPEVYILPANEINAFAAGLKPDKAAVAITAGALKKLSESEVRAVMAHELGHLRNGDSMISLRLAALVMGFYFVFIAGMKLMQISMFRRESEDKKGTPLWLIALALLAAGLVTYFAGSILKATVSRQREYLADASSLELTGSPEGIVGALKKIENDASRDMPKQASAYSHLYLIDRSFFAELFATHPPIEKRIARVLGREPKE